MHLLRQHKGSNGSFGARRLQPYRALPSSGRFMTLLTLIKGRNAIPGKLRIEVGVPIDDDCESFSTCETMRKGDGLNGQIVLLVSLMIDSAGSLSRPFLARYHSGLPSNHVGHGGAAHYPELSHVVCIVGWLNSCCRDSRESIPYLMIDSLACMSELGRSYRS
ncbi:hypothetical protein LZ30DRAFT_250952 [Colletotrichum cereale]|nr:hypothetical protein LZ30DRAFT_250952 [Colletotrichum cereale]